MTTRRTLACAASAMAFIAISGTAYAATTMPNRIHEVEHRRVLMQAPTQVTHSFDAMSQQAPEDNTHRYFGGPKSDD